MSETQSWRVRATNNALELVAGLGMLLAGVVGILFPLLGIVGPLSLATTVRTVDIDTQVPRQSVMASEQMALGGSGQGHLSFSSPGTADRLPLALPDLVSAVLLLIIFDVLRRLARTFHPGDFFLPRNTRRLRVIAGVIFLIGTLPPALDVLTTNLLADGTPVEQAVDPSYVIDKVAVLGALLTAAVAAAFRQGVRLRADTEGLV